MTGLRELLLLLLLGATVVALLFAVVVLARLRRLLAARGAELERQRQRLEQADRLKSEFLANMSHELRTPLNSVIGFSDLLQLRAAERLREDERRWLQDIVLAGRHLLLIINDILDLAKIEAGQLRLSVVDLDPESAALEAAEMMLGQAGARRIEVRADARASRLVRADPDRLRQVLLNLLSNAIKFGPEGSLVELRVRDEETPAGPRICFSVVDRGPGIDAELQARLFQPFVQGEGPLVKRHEGTGLGLAICRRLAEMHGGEIGVASKLGEGATFTVRLPAAGIRPQLAEIDAASATGAAARSTEAGSGPLVLVADDNQANRELVRAILEHAGYRVIQARDGEEAIALSERERPPLVIMDLAMPRTDGFAAIRALRAAPALARTRVLALSAMVMRADEERALAAGADEFLRKPVEREALVAATARLLGDGGGTAA